MAICRGITLMVISFIHTAVTADFHDTAMIIICFSVTTMTISLGSMVVTIPFGNTALTKFWQPGDDYLP